MIIRETQAPAAWFERWFDSPHYHRLYSHRDESEAARFVNALMKRLHPEPGSKMLDLGCGTGRHSKSLASWGFDVTGVDLASSSIAEAKKLEGMGLRFFRQDMRIPFGEEQYDYIFSFFTSFGYFDGLAEHLLVLRNVADSLRQGGALLLDYLNPRAGQSAPAGQEVKEIEGVRYHLTRWSDESHLYKKISVQGEGSTPIEHTERVARFGLLDFEVMLALNELRIEEVYGDYDLNPYDGDDSPRMIVLARKESRKAIGGRSALDAFLERVS